MTLQTIAPLDAQKRIEQGAILIDIRAADEYRRAHIAAARHLPADSLSPAPLVLQGAATVIFHCQSGQRTRMQAARLAASTSGEAFILDGGLDAWQAAGLPVVRDVSQPLPLQRQVQIVAGSLVFLGTVLGALVAPGFYVIPGFIGAGLVFAGISGFCGMARLLLKMPWNRRLADG